MILSKIFSGPVTVLCSSWSVEQRWMYPLLFPYFLILYFTLFLGCTVFHILKSYSVRIKQKYFTVHSFNMQYIQVIIFVLLITLFQSAPGLIPKICQVGRKCSKQSYNYHDVNSAFLAMVFLGFFFFFSFVEWDFKKIYQMSVYFIKIIFN